MCQMHHQQAGEVRTNVGVSEFVEELVVAITSIRVYWHEHPRVQTSLETLVEGLEELLERMDTQQLDLGASEGYLFVGKRPLLGASLAAARILEPLDIIGSGGISFRRGAAISDFVPLMQLLSRKRLEDIDVESANGFLESERCTAISCLPPFRRGRGDSPIADEVVDVLGTREFQRESDNLFALDIPVRMYQEVVDHMQSAMVSVCSGEGLDLDATKGHVETILRKIEDDPKAALSMSRYEQYDAFTFGHSIRVCMFALSFARAMHLEPELVNRIGAAALLHDVGKARVPFEVLHSTGRLSDDERREMSRHAVHGAEILLEMDSSDPLAIAAAFGHHRTMAGGYPATLHTPTLSTATSIVKICDVYEALTAVRPYKDRMSPMRAFRIMMSMNDHFDPKLLRKFMQVTGIYPIGSRVRLSNGEIARVFSQTSIVDRPTVDVEELTNGEPYARDQQRRVDLSSDDSVSVDELLLGAEMS
ncbi:MAG: HD domain-containing protein [bacterium]|nr:HD domain-containing protein [bacterium]